MKKILSATVSLILLLFLSCNNLWAKFGIKTGTTLSFAGENSAIYNASNLFAAKAGLFYSFAVAKSFSIQPEIYFAMKGGEYYSVYWRSEESVRLNYIEIPVLINIHLMNERIDFYLGPYIGFLISSTEIDDEHDWTWVENEIKNSDFGISIGARYHLIQILFIEINFNNGFTKVVYDPNPVPHAMHRAHKNKTLSLLIGFNF